MKGKKPLPPEDIFGELFEALHREEVLSDGKRITDAIPKESPEFIMKAYRQEKASDEFDLEDFFIRHFEIHETASSGFESDRDKPVEEHINVLWDVLSRKSLAPVEGSTALPLPLPYIVPGGRFNEIYYWDSYFTMLGLRSSGRMEMIRHMVDNFAHMIHTYGFIPNGNRTYFLSRSQPPFFSLMVQLLASSGSPKVFLEYKDALEKEYGFWMRGKEKVGTPGEAIHRVAMCTEGLANRYFDEKDSPRSEMYGTDLELCASAKRSPTELMRNIRAACESGWDFSSRWLDESHALESIHCTDILPVDLNCLLYNLENILTRVYELYGHFDQSIAFRHKAAERKALIQKVFWDESEGFFMDYNFRKEGLSSIKSLAGVYPLYFGIATKEQASSVAGILSSKFLKDGGLVTTLNHSGQQWDAPNGWAPLQWMTIKGLKSYGFDDLAEEISRRWCALNIKVYHNTGKLLEKYNVENTNLTSGGGEYPVQDGFGWTNGVLLALLSHSN